VIADVVNYAVAGIGFIHALGRLFVSKGFRAGKNTVMTQNWTRRRDQCRERNISALTKAP
jgi:hypothetical protein